MTHYEYSYVIEEVLDTGVLSALISGIPSGMFGIAAYVLTALALYTLAQRRGLNRPWLAWIPVVNCWILGSLSDQYRYVVKGEIKSKRKVLLVLRIISAVLVTVFFAVLFAMIFKLVMEVTTFSMDEEELKRYASELDELLLVADALADAPEDEYSDPFSQARTLTEWRQDAVKETSADRAILLRACGEDGYFNVPRAVEEQA